MDRVFVANRGEIAVRVVRAARDAGIASVVPYTPGDVGSLATILADHAVPLPVARSAVDAYLDADLVVEVAVRHGCDALHPGYGFLSESPSLAHACDRAGVVFVGPSAEVLASMGDKTTARRIAQQAGVPTPAASGPVSSEDEAVAAVRMVGGYPVFVKASHGGGGRGLRRVATAEQLRDAVAEARSEAAAAFGEGTVYLEQAIDRPRHVEVQVLGDRHGSVTHLHERDCSVQRRHQKLVEMAPAPGLAAEVRARLHADALTIARAVGYQGAGTVEFLVGADGSHHFIEMNPRLQVEHTVTEEITGVDLVTAQLRIADGATLEELGLAPGPISARDAAVQVRVTCEDPAHGFRPAVGTLTGHRLPAGPGIRVEAGVTELGATVTSDFDSLLLKLVARGPDMPVALTRAWRALGELALQGVPTNADVLRAVLAHPAVAAGTATTDFLVDHPDLLDVAGEGDPVLFVAERTARRPFGPPPQPPVADRKPPQDPAPDRAGSRSLLRSLGPEGFAAHVRTTTRVGITDTTLRDAHQSLLATRVRTVDLVPAARATDRVLRGLYSLEAWGGATHDAALRFCLESPWERLERLRDAAEDTCLQMLLRGRNLVAYGTVPDRTLVRFVRRAARTGIDVFRIFDALNNADRMTTAIRAVVDEGGLAEGTLCYTGDLTDPAERVYTLDHYLATAAALVDAGAHVLCIKDMAGVLTPPAARRLVTSLRDRFDAPVHLHTHDTGGGQLATCLAAVEAGVDVVDTASSPLAGGSSQPSLVALLVALAGTARSPDLSVAAARSLEPYWATVRSRYAPFDVGQSPPDGLVQVHQMPGGQVSNLRHQAQALGLSVPDDRLARAYASASHVLGDPIKVTPTSKVVGDLALFMLASDLDAEALASDPDGRDLPASVVDYLRGDLGVPPGGWPEPLRSRVLARCEPAGTRHGAPAPTVPDDDDTDPAGLDAALLPEAHGTFARARATYGDLQHLPTEVFLHGLAPGRVVHYHDGRRPRLLELLGTSAADAEGATTVVIRTESGVRVVAVPGPDPAGAPSAVTTGRVSSPGDVATVVPGVVTLRVRVGDRVSADQVVGVVEAMKMQTALRATVDGVVTAVHVGSGTTVAAGTAVLTVEPVTVAAGAAAASAADG